MAPMVSAIGASVSGLPMSSPPGAQRRRDFLLDELAHAFPGQATRQTRGEPAVRDGVVARCVARRNGRSRREPLLHEEMVEPVVGFEHQSADPPEPCAVRHQLTHRDALFARLAELRPVRGHGGVVFQQTSVGETVQHRRGHAFGHGKAESRGVVRPRPRLGGVRPSGADVDERPFAAAQGQRPAAAPERAAEERGERFETW
nr:hypothetical protein [Segniliparus rotundus]